ncbi:MAG TPA: acyltransferase [Rhizomicrobium sp.]|jgi:peptidoglycan/LPS O-acetylase OafA/YrhL|nr:acyltransferase [Rhizomicrobium sp.]
MSGAAHISTRFRALDGWRGVCALLVAAHHLEVHGALYWQPLVRNAWLFVDFFFVLSGFVIAHAYGAALDKGPEIKAFVIRRFGRLWPLHAAMLLALIGLELAHLVIAHAHPMAGERAAFTADRSPMAILANLFLVQSLGLQPYETWNGPAWSISTEFCTYLVFAAVCFFVPSRRLRVAAAAFLAVAGVAVLACVSRYGMRETFDWGIARCLYGFFAGVLTYEIWKTGTAKALGGTWAEGAMLAAVVAFLTFVLGHRALEFLATPLFAAAVLVFAGERGLISRVLTSRPAAALGRWSYSIYMVHTLVLAVLFSAIHSGEILFHRRWLIDLPDGNAIIDLGFKHYASGLLLAYLMVVIALAAFTWRFVEQPGQRFFARFIP